MPKHRYTFTDDSLHKYSIYKLKQNKKYTYEFDESDLNWIEILLKNLRREGSTYPDIFKDFKDFEDFQQPKKTAKIKQNGPETNSDISIQNSFSALDESLDQTTETDKQHSYLV